MTATARDGSSGAGGPGGTWTRAVLASVLLLLVLRDTSLWIRPVIRAEEGNFFYNRAFSGRPLFGWHWADVGYLDLVPVVAAVTAARWFPIEVAPYVFAGFALLAQILPSILVLRSRSPVFASLPARAAGALAVPLATPHADLWLCTLGSKFFLVTVPILVLLDAMGRADRSRSGVAGPFLMLLSGLSSGLAFFVSPLVLGLAVRPGGRRLRIPAASFAAGLAVQAAFVLAAQSDIAVGGRSRLSSALGTGIHGVVDGLVGGILGPETATECLKHISGTAIGSILHGFPARLLGLGVLAALFFFIARPRSREVGLLTASYALVLTGSVMFSIAWAPGPFGSGLPRRYLIAPMLFLFWLLVPAFASPVSGLRRLAALILGAAILAQGTWQVGAAEVAPRDRPDWSKEVALWRENPDHMLRIVPEPWHVPMRSITGIAARVEYVHVPGERARLRLGVPRLGAEVPLHLEGAAAGASGFLAIVDGAPVAPRPVPDVPGALLVTPGDAKEWPALPFRCDDQGVFTHSVPLVDSGFYAGRVLTLQAILTSPPAGASNAAVVTLGY